MRDWRRTLIISVFLFLTAGAASATGQFPDKLLYQGQERLISTSFLWPSILQVYYLVNKDIDYPFTMTGTACYRGHIATWAIDGGRLFLCTLETREGVRHGTTYRLETRSLAIPEVLRPKLVGDRVLADWFTGFILVYDLAADGWSVGNLSLLKFDRGRLVAEKPYTGTSLDTLEAAYNSAGSSGDELFDQYCVYMQKLVRLQEGTITAAELNMSPDPKDWSRSAIAVLLAAGAILGIVVVRHRARRRGERHRLNPEPEHVAIRSPLPSYPLVRYLWMIPLVMLFLWTVIPSAPGVHPLTFGESIVWMVNAVLASLFLGVGFWNLDNHPWLRQMAGDPTGRRKLRFVFRGLGGTSIALLFISVLFGIFPEAWQALVDWCYRIYFGCGQW